MVAIVTKEIRVQNAANFISDVGSNSMYLFVGPPQQWPSSDTAIATPVNRVLDSQTAHQRMTAAKKIGSGDVTHASTRYNWVSGNSYVGYDDTVDLSTSQYYVLTDELKCYKCIIAGPGASVNKPTGTTTNNIEADQGDGYRWKYMFTLSGVDATKFLTSAFMPSKTLSSDDGSLQFQVQSNADVGAIHHIVVTAGGSGYTSAPTVTISGDGTSATATATVSAGAVTAVTISNNGGNYENATVSFSGGGGSNAAARAIISPKGGHGSDPINELNSFFVMSNVKLDGAEGSGDFPIDNDYRQIGILRNPFNHGTTTVATATTLNANKSLALTSVSGTFVIDELITGGSSGAVAYVDSIDGTTIRYHQDASTGFTAFTGSEAISGAGGATANVSSIGNPEIEKHSGQVMYLENRAKVTRATAQIEDIKLVIEF